MRQFLVATSFLLLTISIYSQTAGTQPQPCTLKLSQTPSVRGVKLDMTVDQLLSLFPGSSDNAEVKQRLSESEGYPNFGEATFAIQPSIFRRVSVSRESPTISFAYLIAALWA